MKASAVLSALRAWLSKHAHAPVKLVVAYSGGRDSHVLLQALHELHSPTALFSLRAIHVNHGLHPKANEWTQHCERICQSLSIPLTTLFLGLKPQKGDSIEALARTHRYLALAQELQDEEWLLTAHTLDDQAETCLLQLLRGAGPLGLGGIAATKTLAKGKLGRPLLAVNRTDIAAFAQMRQLAWVEDETNQDPRFRRNFLRHFIFPQLQKVYPALNACIARSGAHCYESQLLLNEFLEQELKHCLGPSPHILNLTPFKQLSPLKQPYVLRYWLRLNRLPAPSTKKLNDLLQQVLTAATDAQPCIAWEGVYLRRYQEALYSLPKSISKRSSKVSLPWRLEEPLQLPDGSIWQAQTKKGQGVAKAKLTTWLDVSFRQGGERCRPAGNLHSRPLKKILQERRIPPWQRDHLPLFYHQGSLVSVGDLFICEGWQNTEEKQEGWVIERVS